MLSTTIKLIKYLPQYLEEFIYLLLGTTVFISSKDTYDSVVLERSVFFLCVSLGIADIMLLPILPPEKSLINYLTTGLLFYAIFLAVFIITLQFAWLFMNRKTSLRGFCITYSYYYGIINLLAILLLLVCLGMFKGVEPVMYAKFLDAVFISEPLPDLFKCNIIGFIYYLFIGGALFIFIWANVAWRVFRKVFGISKHHSCAMPLFLVLISLPVSIYLYIAEFRGLF